MNKEIKDDNGLNGCWSKLPNAQAINLDSEQILHQARNKFCIKKETNFAGTSCKIANTLQSTSYISYAIIWFSCNEIWKYKNLQYKEQVSTQYNLIMNIFYMQKCNEEILQITNTLK